MSLSRLWLVLAVALPVLGSLLATMSTVDLTYHLRAGAEIVSARALPTADLWTFTAAGEPWVDQQWGAQVLLRATEALGGWTGLAVLRAVLIGMSFGVLLVVVRRSGLSARSAALLTIATFAVALPALALRPQLFGVLAFVLVLALVADRDAHPRRLWIVPIIVAVWANLHGSFFLGPAVLVLAWLQDLEARVERRHAALVVGIACAAAACLTPFGPAVWTYAIGLSVDPDVTARITEWQPTSIRELPGMLFFASALGVATVLARRDRPILWTTLAWFGAFFVVGVYAQRGLAWWPFAAAVAVAPLLVPRPDVEARPQRIDPPLIRRLNVAIVAGLVLAAIALLPAWRPIDPGTQAPRGLLTQAPSAVTSALRASLTPGDHVFNPQPWGSWFEYGLPGALYAIDSRIELFPTSVWDDVEAITAGVEGWEDRLAMWEVDVVVTDPMQTEFADRLRAAGWFEVADGSDGAVFRRP